MNNEYLKLMQLTLNEYDQFIKKINNELNLINVSEKTTIDNINKLSEEQKKIYKERYPELAKIYEIESDELCLNWISTIFCEYQELIGYIDNCIQWRNEFTEKELLKTLNVYIGEQLITYSKINQSFQNIKSIYDIKNF